MAAGFGGAKGADGSAGSVGATGPAGATGPTGPAGSDATVTYAAVATALAAAADATTTVDGPIVITETLTTTKTAGVTLKEDTASDVSNTVRVSPSLLFEGRARVSGSDRTFDVRATLVPTTGGNVDLVFERDLGAGGGYVEFFRVTTSTAGQQRSGPAASQFHALGTSGAFYFDADNSALRVGSNGEIVLECRATGFPALLKGYATAADTAAFQIWAVGEAKTALERMFDFGSGTPTFALAARMTGDGVLEHPDLHVFATVKAADFTAVEDTTYMVDFSANRAVTIPAPSAANMGHRIRFVQTVQGANTMTLTPASGQIETQANATFVGTAAIAAATPGIAVTIESYGVLTGTPGWKVI